VAEKRNGTTSRVDAKENEIRIETTHSVTSHHVRKGHELHTKPPLDVDALGKKPFKKKTKNKAALKEGWAKKKPKGAAKSKVRKPSGGRDTGGGNQGLKRKKAN